ncbi:hypothetical protein D1872_288600 [compost metagenome]
MHISALPFFSNKHFISGRVIDDPDDNLTLMSQCNGYRIIREAMYKIRRTVNRINNP